MDKIKIRIYKDTKDNIEYCALGISFKELSHTASSIENFPIKIAWGIIKYYKNIFDESLIVDANGTRIYFKFKSLDELNNTLDIIFKPDMKEMRNIIDNLTEDDNTRYARASNAYNDRKVVLENFVESPYTEINDDIVKRTFKEFVLDEDLMILSLFDNQFEIKESDILGFLEKYFKELLDSEIIPEKFNEVHPGLIPERLYMNYTPDLYKYRRVNSGMNLITLNYRSNQIPSHSLAGEFVTHILFRGLFDINAGKVNPFRTHTLVCRLCEHLRLFFRTPYIVSLVFCFDQNVTDDMANYHYKRRKRHMKDLRKYISKKRFNRYKKELIEFLNEEGFDYDMLQMDSPSLNYFGTDKKMYIEFAENLEYKNYKKVVDSLEFVEMIVEGDGKDANVDYVRR